MVLKILFIAKHDCFLFKKAYNMPLILKLEFMKIKKSSLLVSDNWEFKSPGRTQNFTCINTLKMQIIGLILNIIRIYRPDKPMSSLFNFRLCHTFELLLLMQ